ncbi:hypothetical protein GN956_G25211 [Arapaima gigas]
MRREPPLLRCCGTGRARAACGCSARRSKTAGKRVSRGRREGEKPFGLLRYSAGFSKSRPTSYTCCGCDTSWSKGTSAQPLK